MIRCLRPCLLSAAAALPASAAPSHLDAIAQRGSLPPRRAPPPERRTRQRGLARSRSRALDNAIGAGKRRRAASQRLRRTQPKATASARIGCDQPPRPSCSARSVRGERPYRRLYSRLNCDGL
ncbi:hypothetical protein XhyaCFBP1156_09610 [Xanthomonas hyacinthi]|uniref:Uncharacterized protein n=1 Tax=Xanthomonas hyacinthi TaxID=56455 RepID=A0A2S7EWX6_9XANT|nr:hypothetical protein XhyaCFBP1156_09610 [Xanthomonas hyacinthi]